MKSVFLDGLIYVLIQLLLVLSTQFGTDEAAKYIEPETLFWTKIVIGEAAAGVMAIKLFRSTIFARYQANGKTPPLPPPDAPLTPGKPPLPNAP